MKWEEMTDQARNEAVTRALGWTIHDAYPYWRMHADKATTVYRDPQGNLWQWNAQISAKIEWNPLGGDDDIVVQEIKRRGLYDQYLEALQELWPEGAWGVPMAPAPLPPTERVCHAACRALGVDV